MGRRSVDPVNHINICPNETSFLKITLNGNEKLTIACSFDGSGSLKSTSSPLLFSNTLFHSVSEKSISTKMDMISQVQTAKNSFPFENYILKTFK